jgi:hypothetical protein
MDSFDVNELKFKIPSGMIISGPSNSGKTQFLLKLLRNAEQMFEPPPKCIIYCYGEYHDYIPELEIKQGIRVHAGAPTDDEILAFSSLPKPFILCLDDLVYHMPEKSLNDIFTKKAHHQNYGVILLTQHLFEKNLRVARTNAQYLILMAAPNAVLQIRNLGAQLFPRQLSYFLSAYEQAVKENYGYLLLNLHAGSNKILKLQTNIFPAEERTIFLPL